MKQETFDKLLNCENMSNVEEILDTQVSGEDYDFVDEKIDDGCDDDEDDEYVMMRSYNFFVEGTTHYVRFYYGDNTWEIGCHDDQVF